MKQRYSVIRIIFPIHLQISAILLEISVIELRICAPITLDAHLIVLRVSINNWTYL